MVRLRNSPAPQLRNSEGNAALIIGIGVDMVDVDRIKAAIERRGGQLVARAFTDEEAAYCWRSQCPERRFAGRFAAKEAVMKALGRGWFQGMPFKEIEVLRDETPEGYGRPGVQLSGKTAELAESLHVVSIHLTITHEQRAAIAFVVIEGAG